MKRSYKLISLYEGTPSGGISGRYTSGFSVSKNLGDKIAKAMGLYLSNIKKNQRTPKARTRMLSPGTKIATSPMPKKPRHRKYFGMNNPHIPY